jgi:3-methyladenine DNA glycosylase AlkD
MRSKMRAKKRSPENIARTAQERLSGLADPVKAAGVQKYFRQTVKAYGVAAPDIRALARELHHSIKETWSVGDAVALCDILFAEPELEGKAVGALILARFKKDFPPSLLTKVKGWLAADLLDNWASVDVFCTDAMGAFLQKYPADVEKIKTWAFHRNRWVKRASAVSFIKLAKKEEFLTAIYEIAASLFPVDDDLIHKANGWLLREAGKSDACRLEKFLLRHGPAIPRTTLRYAIERFPETKRGALLLRTK